MDVKENDLPRIGTYPFFTPQISIDMSFGELGADPSSLVDDGALIERFGGGDARYADPDYQARILESWNAWRADECP